MGKKTEYDLDKDGVLDELELAMEKRLSLHGPK